MLTPIDMKEWEKTCREKTGLGFETFKTVTHCDAETLDALLEAASGSIKGTMYFDWLMEYLSLAQSGKNADVKPLLTTSTPSSKCWVSRRKRSSGTAAKRPKTSKPRFKRRSPSANSCFSAF